MVEEKFKFKIGDIVDIGKVYRGNYGKEWDGSRVINVRRFGDTPSGREVVRIETPDKKGNTEFYASDVKLSSVSNPRYSLW